MITKSRPRINMISKMELLQKAKSIRATDPNLADGLEDIAYGRVISQEELFKKLDL